MRTLLKGLKHGMGSHHLIEGCDHMKNVIAHTLKKIEDTEAELNQANPQTTEEYILFYELLDEASHLKNTKPNV